MLNKDFKLEEIGVTLSLSLATEETAFVVDRIGSTC